MNSQDTGKLEKLNGLRHFRIFGAPFQNLRADRATCAECQASCQSACKTSCTVGNIECELIARPTVERV